MATAPVRHTYDRKCRLRPVTVAAAHDDEPRSTGIQASTSDRRAGKKQLRPFGPGDNNTLERTWLSLASEECHNEHENLKENPVAGGLSKNIKDRRARLVKTLASNYLNSDNKLSISGNESTRRNEQLDPRPRPPATSGLSDVRQEVITALEQSFCALARQFHQCLAIDSVLEDVVETIGLMRTTYGPGIGQAAGDVGSPSSMQAASAPYPKSEDACEDRNMARSEEECVLICESRSVGQKGSVELPPQSSSPSRVPETSPASEATISNLKAQNAVSKGGNHTWKLVSNSELPHSQDSLGLRDSSQTEAWESDVSKHKRDAQSRALEGQTSTTPESIFCPDNADVVVGLSRLHQVTLPALQMKPIYWSPVNDIVAVTRATWFYRDTMMPVAAAVANQLEAGYCELRPWTETWRDEVRCAIAVGPLGEEKVSHALWPQDAKFSNLAKTGTFAPSLSAHPSCAAYCCGGQAAAEGSIATISENTATETHGARPFAKYHVIYKDDTAAFLLKPNLQPSAYYGRRPLLKLARGLTVGIPVVRGFDWHAWNRLKGSAKTGAAQSSNSSDNDSHDLGHDCPGCGLDKDNGQITDLILVAHGIGQKIAERVESFHFTHAINGFRKAVDAEMVNPVVQNVLRKGHTGVMILPLNWRMGLSFEDGGPASNEEEEAEIDSRQAFGLKDIEPSTIPAVRSMISDVMFDIPFYMSHHKSKMIKSLVAEANRVYRLWCRNNPGFGEKGRVHLIAHSLGSVMAVDVLSRQPTCRPKLDLKYTSPSTEHFEFNTTNLFLLGSPAGFFLLLERGSLTPRHGRDKAGADLRDSRDRSITGMAGTFGCLAVDNIYNILAKEDPIAYLLNGAVDASYAASLKMAFVPTTNTSIFKSLGDTVRQVVPGMAPPVDPFGTEAERPPAVRLPSQLEMEVHNFSREEIAERRAFLLNDNGQIDWFLKSGSGPLEIQYLNMLSAHTSYWINQDFIRLICLETGRAPGRNRSLPAMRAVKSSKRFAAEK